MINSVFTQRFTVLNGNRKKWKNMRFLPTYLARLCVESDMGKLNWAHSVTGVTPLMAAASHGVIDLVELLLGKFSPRSFLRLSKFFREPIKGFSSY